MSQDQNKSISSPGLQKGLIVLEAVAQGEGALSFGQLLEISQTPKSTLIRLLRVLRQEEWLSKGRGGYLPGRRLSHLAQPLNHLDRLKQIAPPCLQSLSELTGNTAALFGIEAYDNELLSKVIHPAAVSMREEGHRQGPDWCSPWGWITLAPLSHHEQVALTGVQDIPSHQREAAELAWKQLNTSGWCLDDQIGIKYVCRMAAPLCKQGTDELIAVLALGGNPLTMPEERREELAALLLDHAIQIMKSF